MTAPDYRVAKCGIYLQDNTREYGGGILAIPKAHKFLFSTRYPKVDFLFKRIFDRLSMYFAFPRKPITLDSKAGDLIVFDSRLPHGSTVPWNISSLNYNTSNGFLTGIPSQHTKIVIYWDACHSKMKKDFMVNAKKRAHKEEKREELYFSDWLKNFFPDDFPEDFVAKAKDYEIEIASWDKNECKEYNQIFEEKSSIVLRK